MPDEIEISDEDFLYDPDSDSELNFVCLEDNESWLSDSDDLGKYYKETSSDDVFYSDVNEPSEPYRSLI